MTEHSALPWTFEKEENPHEYIKTPFYIRSGKYLVAVGGLQAEETIPNARFIITACNCHAALLEALKQISTKGSTGRELYAVLDEMREIARQAIRKSKEQSNAS